MKKTGPTYPAARAVAPIVAEQLAEHLATVRQRGYEELAPQPVIVQIEALIDAAFWASLRKEEGHDPRISLAFLPPDGTGHPMVFDKPLPLSPEPLARLAPAVERAGIHLGVWPDGGKLRVWGTTRSVPNLTFVLEVVEPGVLVLKYRRGDELDKFGTIAVLRGDRIEVVDEGAVSLPDCPALLSTLLGFGAQLPAAGPTDVLIQLAVSMRTHGRGGSLLVVPAAGDGWRDSALQPMPYRVAPYADLSELLRAGDEERARSAWRESLRRSVAAVAGLTAVDGATVINERHEVLAFGVKLVRKRGSERVDQVAVTAPVMGNAPEVVDPSRLGGTRHLSAAQFIHDQRDALALVASQDGRFTVFAWSPCEGMVHAHRVETLLM
ncbi:putative sensor domain DACNV-containing protein [Longimicrobium terrae]|uniref:Probable sensor domain-containing protein n=1 Tax=Longimicrobium terrae TaxID=1639882 RepID=A0A841H0K2_9BACT|nr:hypothetical protein [Longimicrobium terrae]MBB4636928.1 hypothetical protein [Longimicrobium terrae]MBB6071464.1 hypothetical protein [Longimicrobium terrae]